MKGHLTKKIKKEFSYELAILCLSVAAVCLLYGNNLLLTFVLASFWGVCLKLWHTADDLYLYASGTIVGPTVEIICVYFGAWYYANPTFLGIPLWLPLAWGTFTVMIFRVAKTFGKIRGKK